MLVEDITEENIKESKRKLRRERRLQKKHDEAPYLVKAETVQKVYRNNRLPPSKVAPEPDPEPDPEPEVFARGNKSCFEALRRLNPWRQPPPLVEYNLDPNAIKAVEALCINLEQVQMLKDKFDDIDIAGRGQIQKQDFWDYIDVVPSPFTDKLFEMIDVDASGLIDFGEFLSILSTYCIFNRDDILRFAFDCFDLDGSNSIDEEEVVLLIDMLNSANPKFQDTIDAAIEMIRADDDGQINFAEFREINRAYPLLLMPAFDLQDKMQIHTLGAQGWIDVMENLAHAEEEIAIRESQFGKPIQRSEWHDWFVKWGFRQKYKNMDVDYINGMRPSRLAEALENKKDDDDDDEPPPLALTAFEAGPQTGPSLGVSARSSDSRPGSSRRSGRRQDLVLSLDAPQEEGGGQGGPGREESPHAWPELERGASPASSRSAGSLSLASVGSARARARALPAIEHGRAGSERGGGQSAKKKKKKKKGKKKKDKNIPELEEAPLPLHEAPLQLEEMVDVDM